jgi:toxin ParE1/3/4
VRRLCWPTFASWSRTIKERQLQWSRAARADLRAIYRHIAAENPAAADQFITDLDRKARSVAELGLTGVDRSVLAPGLRAFAYKDRCFYFRVTERSLLVVRVVHGRQDIAPDDFADAGL